MYNLHSNDIKGCSKFWIPVSIINLLLFIGTWIAIHFAAANLEWPAFKNIWWLGPDTLIVEFFWEVFIDIPHVFIADALNRDKRNCTRCRGKTNPEFRKMIERCVANNIILTYLAGF